MKTSGKDNRDGILQKSLKLIFGGNCNEIITCFETQALSMSK